MSSPWTNPWIIGEDEKTERDILTAMVRHLYRPKEAEALQISAYSKIVASRFREKLEQISEDPVPKALGRGRDVTADL